MKAKNTTVLFRLVYATITPLLTMFVSGCVHVTSKHTVEPIIAVVKKANAANHVEGVREFALSTSPLLPSVTSTAPNVENSLRTAGLDKLSAVQKILSSAQQQKPVKLNNYEMKDLAKAVLDRLHSGAFNGTPRKDTKWHAYAERLTLAKEGKEKILFASERETAVDVFSLLEAYYIAYANGQFTLRDGTVLGKPKGSFGITNGVFAGAIPNDTVDGVVTIFTEAVGDSLFQTPLYFSKTSFTNFVSYYVPASKFMTNMEGYVQLFRPSVGTTNDFFLSGKTPTASKFLPCYPIVMADNHNMKSQKGLTKKEVQFIQAVSGLTAKQSQALAGLIFRTFGGAAGGQFVFAHVSFGNNQVLSSVVDNLMSSFSYHLTERTLNEVFVQYQGGNDEVEALLDHYQDLLKIVTS